MTKYVYDFVEGNKDLQDLLGGKGANLAEIGQATARRWVLAGCSYVP